MITIREPIWNGGKRYLGLADYRVLQEPATVTVECTYTNKEGIRLYPKLLKISKAMVLCRNIMTLKHTGTKLYLVPLDAFECPMTKGELTSEKVPEFKVKQGKML